jgi:type IV pilus assembly protein PilA
MLSQYSIAHRGVSRFADRRTWDAGDAGEDAGFTLIELMVVLLILAILLAIAIPTFLGVTKSANDRAAQSNLNTALVNAKSLYQSQGQSYTNATVTNSTLFASTLQSAEPALTFGTTGSATQGNVSVQVSTDGNGVVMAAYSKSTNNCWLVIDNPAIPTQTTNAPWTGTATASGLAGTGTAVAIVVPSTQGTTYAEVKGDTTGATDCNASAPAIKGTTAKYQYSTTGFPV